MPKKKEIEVKFSKAACRPYQPSDKQSQSIVQVELRTLPASKIQIPAGKKNKAQFGSNC